VSHRTISVLADSDTVKSSESVRPTLGLVSLVRLMSSKVSVRYMEEVVQVVLEHEDGPALVAVLEDMSPHIDRAAHRLAPHVFSGQSGLSPQKNSVGLISILFSISKQSIHFDKLAFVQCVELLVLNAPFAGVGCLPVKFAAVVSFCFEVLVDMGKRGEPQTYCSRAFNLTDRAIQLLQHGNSALLTPLHWKCLWACLKSRSFFAADSLLLSGISGVDMIDGIQYAAEDFLLFFYYAALTCISKRRFDLAEKYLIRVCYRQTSCQFQ